MTRPPRKPLRPSTQAGVMEKRFKRLAEPKKRVRTVADRAIVLLDLKRGSLASLDRYLAKHKGIPDRAVALELRKLISGTAERSRYRLTAVEHPDLPVDRGGRPKKAEIAPSARDWEIVDRYEALLAQEGKAWRARELALEEFEVSPRTVSRAIEKVKQARAQIAAEASAQLERREALTHREAALRRLREESSGTND